VPVNVTTTTDIGQPRSLSARQMQELKGSFSFLDDFDYMSQFACSHDFGTHSFAKLLPVRASSSHLLDIRMQAINALICTNIPDFKLNKTQNVNDSSLGNELVPPLDLQADQELRADVRAANKAANNAGMWSTFELQTADYYTAAFPTACCWKIDSGQVGNIDVANLPKYDETAPSRAVQFDGTQSTLMGDSPAATSFQQATETAHPACVAAPPVGNERFQHQRGPRQGPHEQGRGGRNTPDAEQVSGPGAEKAPGRSQ
jgi:hypothetical protein